MNSWNSLVNRFASLQRRERVVVWVAGLVAIAMAWYFLFAEQTLARDKRLGSQAQSLEQQLAGFESQLQLYREQTASGTDQVTARLNEVRQRSAAVQSQIDDYAAELISPTEMARLLERVLARRATLELRHLANHGAEDLLPGDVPGEQRLYRHRFEMELEGPYLEVLAYLEDLEGLPWRLYWQAIEIETDKYPRNRVRIEVATLSLHEEWIGV
ncbi:MAG: hypothetical protein KJO55_02745 [Gammaproteobacteria bacterium]|nr:hypothetical protein [Gammaproteobacteria bacterium]